jgi:hypothetical protein
MEKKTPVSSGHKMDPQVKSFGKSLNKDVKFDGLFHEWEMTVEAGDKDLGISPLRLLKTNPTNSRCLNDIKFLDK